jgi:hypothetical protein
MDAPVALVAGHVVDARVMDDLVEEALEFWQHEKIISVCLLQYCCASDAGFYWGYNSLSGPPFLSFNPNEPPARLAPLSDRNRRNRNDWSCIELAT